MKKRVALQGLCLKDLSAANPGGSPDSVIPDALPALPVEFSFSVEPLGGFGPAIPEVEIAFSFPADDRPRVEAWFSGDFSHVTLPESATLHKNMTSAVHAALGNYFSNASSRNLFTSPFMIGWRYRLADGSTRQPEPPRLLIPNAEAPLLPVTEWHLLENAVSTRAQVGNAPSRLRYSLPPVDDASPWRGVISSVEFFITRPTPLYDSKGDVSGVKSVMMEGERRRVWQYASYDAESVQAAARADTDFRVIAVLPFAQVAAGAADEPLPVEAGALIRFGSLPKLTDKGASSGGSTSESGSDSGCRCKGVCICGKGEHFRSEVHFETPPLDLGLPEDRKWVESVYLRGVFSRRLPMSLTLYGSQHRDDWRPIGRASGPYLRGIARAGVRWLKVEVELTLRPADTLDALTFEFT